MLRDEAEEAQKAVFEAALVPELWPDALQKVADACDVPIVCAQLANGRDVNILANAEGCGMLDDYVDGGWQQTNARLSKGLELVRDGFNGMVNVRGGLFSLEELSRQPFEQEFVVRHGIECEIARVDTAEGKTIILSALRSLRHGNFDAADMENIGHLTRTITTALRMAMRLKEKSSARLFDTFGGKGDAAAMLTVTGRITRMTESFEQKLCDELKSHCGKLQAKDPETNRKLQMQIAMATSSSLLKASFEPVVIRREGRTPLIVRCMPVEGAARDLLTLSRVMVHVTDLEPEEPVGVEEMLMRAYGLTPREARIAVLIGSGTSIKDACELENIAIDTARSHLKLAFAKTGVNKQSSLALITERMRRA